MTGSLPPLIDTHCHLDNSHFDSDRAEVISHAFEHGVSHMITVGCDLESSRQSLRIAAEYPTIYAAVGIHPHDAQQADDEGLAELRRLTAAGSKVVAVGEMGLDYYRNRTTRDCQQQAFRDQIGLAREAGLPIIVHDRDAHDDVLRILREESVQEIGGVLHCFSGDLAMARACLDLGLYLSFPGPVTYPKNEAIRDVVRAIPIDRMLLETDCPYLAPQPLRGRRNEPAYIHHTASRIAEIKGLTLDDVARVTTLNAYTLFGVGEIDQTSKIAYPIRDSLYLNITNRCTNSCTFCAKFKDFTVKGHHLRLDHEPSADEVKAAVGDPLRYREVVFCGYGEPLIRLELVKEVAAWLKGFGVAVRINTDGQANLVHGRDILPELQGLIDTVSVSLNASDADTYQHYCRSRFGEAGYEAVKDFLREAPRFIPQVTATAVALPGLDMQACREIAESLGVTFREREYNEVG
jgi:TatD DNase family protein